MSSAGSTRAGVLAAVALVGGCQSEAQTFSLRLTWAQDGNQACPHDDTGVATCSEIPLSCNAHARIRILPLDGAVPYYSHCYTVVGGPGRNACALADLDIEASLPIPNEIVRLQVAVWSDEQLATLTEPPPDGCPDGALFDAVGMPLINVTEPALVPALGGEIYFPVGDRRVAEVALGCPRHDQLDLEVCRTNAPTIAATVRYLRTRTIVQLEDTSNLTVEFGGATGNDQDGWRFILNELDDLTPTAGEEVVFHGRLTPPHQLPMPGCVRTQIVVPAITGAATCRDVMVVDDTITTDGFVVDEDQINDALKALGGIPFPTATGLVLGMVVDHNNVRVAGARVTPTPLADVAYPTEDFAHVGLDSTSSRGVFLSTNAAFGTKWDGTDTSGIGDDDKAFGGLIAGHVTVVVVRLNPPIGGGPAAR